MNVLCIGDVVAGIGCRHLQRVLPRIKRETAADVCIVNGENSADGNGMLPGSVEALYAAGADVVTGGNHTFRRHEIFDRLEDDPFLLRPANMPPGTPGRGMTAHGPSADYGLGLVRFPRPNPLLVGSTEQAPRSERPSPRLEPREPGLPTAPAETW